MPAIVGIAEKRVDDHDASAGSSCAASAAYGRRAWLRPAYRDLHGLFVAAGPRVRRGYVAPEFQNIHLYDFMCAVLGLKPATNDGDPVKTAAFLVR